MEQSLSKELGQQNKTLYVLLGLVVLLSLPVGVLLIGTTIELKVTPEDAEEGLRSKLIEGVAIPYLDKLLLISSAAVYELNSPGYEEKKITLNQSASTPNVTVEMTPLPGVVDVEIASNKEIKWRVEGQSVSFTERSGVIELMGGPVTFIVEGPEVETLRTEIIIEGKGARQSVVLKPSDVQATIKFSIKPKNAKVLVNGVEQMVIDGSFTARLAVGINEIEARAPGFREQVRTVAVSRSEFISGGLIELVPEKVNIKIRSKPNRVAVFIDSQFEGETPVEVTVRPLEDYRLTLRKVGFIPVEAVISPDIGENIAKTYALSREQSRLKITSSEPAKIFLNGRLVGETPKEIMAVEGDTVEVTAGGYASESFTVATSHLVDKAHHLELVKSDRKPFLDAPPFYEFEGVEFVRLRGKRDLKGNSAEPFESPHRIADLFVSQSEISQQAFARYSGEGANASTRSSPKTNVSWRAAIDYCNWLSAKAGLDPFYRIQVVEGIDIIGVDKAARGFRLPTLLEWRYFLSGYNDFSNGGGFQTDSIPIERGIGNLAGREAKGQLAWYFDEYVDDYAGLAPITSFRPNQFGLYDLVGNAKEWLHNNSDSAGEHFGSEGGLEHIVAGSSFKTGRSQELDLHYFSAEVFGNDEIGFRVVREIR